MRESRPCIPLRVLLWKFEISRSFVVAAPAVHSRGTSGDIYAQIENLLLLGTWVGNFSQALPFDLKWLAVGGWAGYVLGWVRGILILKPSKFYRKVFTSPLNRSSPYWIFLVDWTRLFLDVEIVIGVKWFSRILRKSVINWFYQNGLQLFPIVEWKLFSFHLNKILYYFFSE
jgi:hypothetical protein